MDYSADKIILTDCDGVLMDWEAAFHDYMSEHGFDMVNPNIYKMHHAYDIAKEESERMIRQFNESAWMGFLEAFRDSRSGIARLVEAGYRFVCITSLSLDKKAQLLRNANLRSIFGKEAFVDVIFLDTGADKDEVLKEWSYDNFYWVEDKTENAICGANLGLNSILIKHGHNEHCEDARITVLDNWNRIADHILNNEVRNTEAA